MPQIIALTGLPAAGKTTLSRHLQDRYGVHWVRTRDIVQKLGGSSSLRDLQDRGLTLSSEEGADLFFAELQKLIHPTGATVIDALRPLSHWVRIKESYEGRALLVGVKAPYVIRKARFEEREPGRNLLERDQHEVEREIPKLLEISDYAVINNATLEVAADLLMAFAYRETVPMYSDLLMEVISHGGPRPRQSNPELCRATWQQVATGGA